ncbi:hypothetical protein PV327_004601 [Microctonus hyperodae]|uniref:Kazal-like domain-containing protein n=1 Tax=Microctonus hyperodae TaxID=165561 RepID=A0AA39KMP4_MICHY|nr:hypothetical protein PV327_004601 [Microctonus hyperodae]
MTSKGATFRNKWLLILLIIATFLKPSVTEESHTGCEKYINYKDYEEVCGTDGTTYSNKLHLHCLNRHYGKDVAIAHLGCCLPGEKNFQYNHEFFIYSPICTPNGRTWSNIHALRCYNRINNIRNERYLMGSCHNDSDEISCTQNVLRQGGFNPVCASNGLTYQNIAEVKCLKKYNPELRVLYDGKCRIFTAARKVQSDIDETKAFRPENIKYVCQVSKILFDPNPICGTDNITYENPFKFFCKIWNTEKVKVAFQGVCDSDAHKECLLADLHLRFSRACRGPADNPCGLVACEGSKFPVCASDNKTYISIEAMWCINRQKNLGLYHRHDGPCLEDHH